MRYEFEPVYPTQFSECCSLRHSKIEMSIHQQSPTCAITWGNMYDLYDCMTLKVVRVPKKWDLVGCFKAVGSINPFGILEFHMFHASMTSSFRAWGAAWIYVCIHKWICNYIYIMYIYIYYVYIYIWEWVIMICHHEISFNFRSSIPGYTNFDPYPYQINMPARSCVSCESDVLVSGFSMLQRHCLSP